MANKPEYSANVPYVLFYIEKKPTPAPSGSGRLGETPSELATLAAGAMRGGASLLFREPFLDCVAIPYSQLWSGSMAKSEFNEQMKVTDTWDLLFAQDAVVARFRVLSREKVPIPELQRTMDRIMRGVEFIPLRYSPDRKK